MYNLSQLVTYIEEEYSQEHIELNVFDYSKGKNEKKPQPQYLYRGERDINWKETKSTFSRNLKDHPYFDEINYWVCGTHPITKTKINDSSLYFFLRDSILSISEFENHQNPNIEESIVGLLQHYEFETSFFDLTGSFNIAAFFACYGAKPGDVGQMMVIPTSIIENQYFDLTNSPGNRPKQQNSYVLWGTPELDLKSNDFTQPYKAKWLEFKLSQSDKKKFDYSEILSTKNDQVVNDIEEWFNHFINNNKAISRATYQYFSDKLSKLKNLK